MHLVEIDAGLEKRFLRAAPIGTLTADWGRRRETRGVGRLPRSAAAGPAYMVPDA